MAVGVRRRHRQLCRAAVVDPPDAGPYYPVQPIETGNDGATSGILERSDVAIADHECPIIAQEAWAPNLSSTSFAFSVPEELVPIWRDTLGLDMIYLAANHMSDKGEAGIQSTLELLDEYGVPRTGMGMNLDEALEPAFLEVAGITVGFVAFNDVVGVTAADAQTPGVAWLTQANVEEAVGRAQDGGADLVICSPQWWGGAEYHATSGRSSSSSSAGWTVPAAITSSGRAPTWPGRSPRTPGRRRPCGARQPRQLHVRPGLVAGDAGGRDPRHVVPWHGARQRPAAPTVHPPGAAGLDPEGDGHYVLERIWKYSQIDSDALGTRSQSAGRRRATSVSHSGK